MSDAKQNGNKGTRTDTSHKISAGTSVGQVGESPMPQSPKTDEESIVQAAREQVRDAAEKVRETVQETQDAVKNRTEHARQRATERYEQASDWAHEKVDRATAWAEDAYDRNHDRLHRARVTSGQAFGRARSDVKDYVAENPLVVGLVGLAAGVLIGALIPRSRRENQAFGEWSDEVRRQGLRYAHDMTKRGREYIDETFNGDDPRFSRHDSEFETEPKPRRQ